MGINGKKSTTNLHMWFDFKIIQKKNHNMPMYSALANLGDYEILLNTTPLEQQEEIMI